MARDPCGSTQRSNIFTQTTVHSFGFGRQLGSEPYIPEPARATAVTTNSWREYERLLGAPSLARPCILEQVEYVRASTLCQVYCGRTLIPRVPCI